MQLTEFEKRILSRDGQPNRAPAAASDEGDGGGFEIIMRGPKGENPDPELVKQTVQYMQAQGLMRAPLKPYGQIKGAMMKGHKQIPSRLTR